MAISLIVQNGNLNTRIEVIPPANRECGDATIKAVVQIKTELPKEIVAGFRIGPELAGTFNRMATLGALTTEKDCYFIGSRLTIYEQEGAWKLHRGVLLSTAILAADSLLGAVRRVFTKANRRAGHPHGLHKISIWLRPLFLRCPSARRAV